MTQGIGKEYFIHSKNGLFGPTTPADLDQLFDNLSRHPARDQLVLYFHGGLVKSQAALSTAETLLDHFLSAQAYPVFFIWESGLVETLSNNLPEIFKEKIFQRLLMRVVQFTVAKLLEQEGERGGRLELPSEIEVNDRLNDPSTEEKPYEELDPLCISLNEELTLDQAQQFKEVLENDYLLMEEAEAVGNGVREPGEIAEDINATRGLRVQASSHTLMSPEVIEKIRQEAGSPDERGLVSTAAIVKATIFVLVRVIERFTRGRDHGVYTTAVEEILREFYLANVGKMFWDMMKKDTVDAFQDSPQASGTAFLRKLKAYWEAGNHPRIILIGHSAGSIYIANLIKAADAILPPELKFDVIFLAPGVSFHQLAETLQSHGERVNQLRIFGMDDALEMKDQITPYIPIYPRSLLYFVSGVLEDEADKPLVGMQRYYSGIQPFSAASAPAIAEVKLFLERQTNPAVWSQMEGGPGLCCGAMHHGDFDDKDEQTLNSIRDILTAGYG